MEEYKFARHVPTMLEMSGPLVIGVDNLYTISAVFGISESLNEGEKLEALKAAFWRARNPSLAEQADAISIVAGEDMTGLGHDELLQKAQDVRTGVDAQITALQTLGVDLDSGVPLAEQAQVIRDESGSSADVDLILDVLEGKV